MSTELRVFLVAMVGVIALYFGLGSVLPQEWHVESSIEVPAPPARIVPLLGDFNAWQRWSDLGQTERPDTKVIIDGTPGNVGHQLLWRAPANEAALRLSRVAADGVEYDFMARLGTGQLLEPQGHGAITIEAIGDGSRIRWRDDCRVVGFQNRWFAWFGAQQEAAHKFQEASLARLRTQLEGK